MNYSPQEDNRALTALSRDIKNRETEPHVERTRDGNLKFYGNGGIHITDSSCSYCDLALEEALDAKTLTRGKYEQFIGILEVGRLKAQHEGLTESALILESQTKQLESVEPLESIAA